MARAPRTPTRRSGSPSPPAPPKRDRASEFKTAGPENRDLAEAGLRLYDLGFNIVPVDGKKPLTSWGSGRRVDRGELVENLKKATGIAVVGGSENPWKPAATLILVDIDDPRLLEENRILRSFVEETVRWRTGPRCPKCFGKQLEILEPGKRFRCGCGHEFQAGEAPRALGAMFTVDPGDAEDLLKGSSRFGRVEILVKNYQLIPPSKHPSGVFYEWIRPLDLENCGRSGGNCGIRSLSREELRTLLESLGWGRRSGDVSGERPSKPLRELGESEIIAVINILKSAYAPGARQHIWLFLSGWGARAGISPVSIAKILRSLYDGSGDEDPIRMRAGAIVYSYKKAGIDLEPYAEEMEKILGVRPYGLEREIREDDVKGRSGVQEILENALGEERALEAIKEIEEIFGAGSPYRDSVIEIMDYEKQIYAVANLRKLVTVRARRDRENRWLVYKERVFIGAPTEVIVYINPIGGVTKYQVRWETTTRPKPLIIGPALLEDIVDRLRAEGLVVNSRMAGDVLASLVEGFIRRGRAGVRSEIEAPGFYIVDGRLVAVKVDLEEPGVGELREALLLLNDLAEKWFKHVIDRFARIIRWGAIAPFIYAYKQVGRWVRWPYLYGSSHTGKTTLGEVVLRMWGLDPGRHVKSGAFVDTAARIGHVLSQSTFPVLINEPAGIFSREDVIEIIKASIENTLARGRFRRGSYEEIPALAPLIFTSNKHLPRDDALLRRLDIMRFTYGEKIDRERAREFDEKVRPGLAKLRAVGAFIASYVLEKGLGEDPRTMAVKVLEEAYRAAGLEKPQWLAIEIESAEEETMFSDIREIVRSFLAKRINEEYNRFVGRIEVHIVENGRERDMHISRTEPDPRLRAEIVLNKKLIPWLLSTDEEVIITTAIIEELKPLIGDIGGLKSLAELLQWDYRPKKVSGKTMWTAIVKKEDFLKLLTPEIEAEPKDLKRFIKPEETGKPQNN